MDRTRMDVVLAVAGRLAGALLLVAGLALASVAPPAAQASSAPLPPAVAAAGLSAAEWSQAAAPLASGAHDSFGFRVAISGDTLVVGAPERDVLREEVPMRNAGVVYVFVRNGATWSRQAELTAPDGVAYDEFGYSVAISGDTIVVGAWSPGFAGAAYVFVRSGETWTQQAKLAAEDGADMFGWAVAASGDTAVVTALHSEGGPVDSGAAYVFVQEGTAWSQQAKLTVADGAALDEFGWDVAISGDTIVVGRPQGSSDVGSAYVFVRGGETWSLQTELTAADSASYLFDWAAGDQFGWCVDISGDAIVVGAPWRLVGRAYKGAAFVFQRSGESWSQQAELTCSDDAMDRFGWSVAISGDTAIVGVALADDEDPGAAYVFVRRGAVWSQQAELTTADGATGDDFSHSVAISGDTVAVGAPALFSHVGAAHVFVRSEATWSAQGKALSAADGTDGDALVMPQAGSGTTFVYGAPHRTVRGQDNAGAVRVSVYAAYGTRLPPELVELTADDGAAADYFGWSVAKSGDTIVAGAPGRDGYTGAAYVFVGSGTAWSQQARLTADDGAPGDYFGWSVAISGDTIVVGTRARNSTGVTYTFVRSGDTWLPQGKVRTTDGAASYDFGYSVTVYGARADVATVIYGVPEGTPVKAWVGGTEQPTLYTAHDAFGRQAVLWTFYPPQSTDWTVTVEPQLPAGYESPRWQYRLVWIEPPPGFVAGESAGGAVTISRCSGTILHFQLVDTGAQ